MSFLHSLFFDSINFQLLEGSIYFFDKYIYIFIFILAFCSWKDRIQILNKSINIIEKILIVNALFIIFGFLFELDFLKSYPGSQRFGYDGLFTNRNQLSSLYLIFIARVYFDFLQNSSKFKLLLFLIFVSLLIGTKIILLFLFLILVYHFCFILKRKVIYRVLIGCLVFSLFIYFKSIANYLFNLFPFWENIGESLSLRSMLFSTRDLVLIQSIDYIKENWTVLNYFIGGSFYTKSFRLIEMDFFAPIMIFGILGFIGYMILIKQYFFERNNFITNSIILIIVICGFLGGGLFVSTPAMIYLYLMSQSMKKSL